MVRAGRLKSRRIGGHLLVSRSEILAFRPQAAGRPRDAEARELARALALLSSIRPETRLEVFRKLREEFPIHPLETRLGIRAEVILEAIERSGSLTLRMIRGVIAQAAFDIYVARELTGWSSEEIDGNPPYDFLLKDEGGSIKVQVKLQRSKDGIPMTARQANRRFPDKKYVVETQRTRGGTDRRTQGSTRPYRFGEFDILAVSMFPSKNSWSSFLYTVADWLLPDPNDPSRLLKFQPISPAPDTDWTDDFETCVTWLRSGLKKTISIE
jgi:hypothetical protein